jgi:hypothetical protein
MVMWPCHGLTYVSHSEVALLSLLVGPVEAVVVLPVLPPRLPPLLLFLLLLPLPPLWRLLLLPLPLPGSLQLVLPSGRNVKGSSRGVGGVLWE